MDFWDFHTHQRKENFSIFNGESIFPEINQWCSLGLHPWFLKENWEERWLEISSIIRTNPSILAIGEAGFDRLKGPELPIQKAAFWAQAKLAKDLDIPLILHCVKAHDLLLEFLKKEDSPPSIIWHGWNLAPHLGVQLLEFPVFFSFGRHLLSPKNNASNWLQEVPLDRVFFETDDSTFEISQIYQAASLILGLSLDQLDLLVRGNWNRISSRKIE